LGFEHGRTAWNTSGSDGRNDYGRDQALAQIDAEGRLTKMTNQWMPQDGVLAAREVMTETDGARLM
jgi:hypothetical protein